MKFLFTLFLFLTSSPLYLFSQQHKLITGEEALAKSTALAQSKQFDSATYYVLIAQEKFKSANRIKDYFRSKIQELQIWIKDGRLEQTFEANHNLLDEIREYYGDSTALEALVYKNFGESYYKKGLLNDATVWWEKSLSLIQNYNEEYYASEIAFLSNNLGISYARRAYYDQAAPHFERALYIYQNYDSKRKARGILRTYNNLGNLNYLLGNIGKAVAMYQKSIELKKKVYKTSQHPSIALSYANMGNMLRAVGRYQEAIEYLNSSIEITKNKQGKDRKALRQSYGVLSEIYRLTKEFDLCKEHIDKEYELRLIDDGPQSLEMANVYVNYGLYFNDIGNYQKAIDYFNKALEIFELKKLPLSEDVGEAHYYIGASYMQLDRREEAMDKFEESRRVFAALDLSKNAMLSVINQGIGKLLSERGEYDLAEKYLWQAINANVKSDWNATDNPLANYHNGSLLLTTIEHLTSLYKEKGLKSDDHTLLTKSLHYIDYGDTLINQLQKTNTNDTDKLLFREKVNKIYETGIWLSYQLYSQSKDAKFVEKAHYFMERNRNSLSLLELNDAQAQLTIGISDSLRETEGELNALISYHKSQIYQLENVDGNIDSVRLDHHRAALFESSQNRRKWIKNIEEDYPDYAQLKYKVDYPTISELQSVLTSDQTLLEYSMGLDAGYGILIGKNNYEFVDLNIDSTYQKSLTNYRQLLQDPLGTRLEDYYFVSNKLYRLLIEQFKSKIKSEIIIIPSKELSLIPFGALVRNMPPQPEISYKSLDYLIKYASVSYLNNTLGLVNPPTQNISGYKGMVAFSPSFDDEKINVYNDTTRSGAARLEWAEKEVDNISQYFDSELLKEGQSTETNFKKLANNRIIVHVASHGFLDIDNPYFSRILIGNDKGINEEDGILYLHEIYNMDLNSELAVLSACNTGAGAVVSGEGVVNLSSGFLAAGINSVLMSLWLVNDRSTSELMTNFYYELDQGAAKHQALRNAKLEYLKNASSLEAHPYFWSAFVINGNMRPLNQPVGWWVWALGLTVITLAALGYYRLKS